MIKAFFGILAAKPFSQAFQLESQMMKMTHCAIIAALLCSQNIAEAGIIDLMRSAFIKKEVREPQSIRILLTHDQPAVMVEVVGKYKIFDPHTGQPIGLSYQGKRRLVQPIPSGIRWGEEFPGIYQMLIVPDAADTLIIVDNIEYRGAVFAYNVGGSISIVNKVNIEDFLSSTLPYLYRDPLPAELLASIAIVARTYAYYQVQHAPSPFWDIDATNAAYHGVAFSRRFKPIENAIRDTKYMVLNRMAQEGWQATAFAAAWRYKNDARLYKERIYSAITLEEAESLAKKGLNAPQILRQAFPDTTIKLEYSADQS